MFFLIKTDAYRKIQQSQRFQNVYKGKLMKYLDATIYCATETKGIHVRIISAHN